MKRILLFVLVLLSFGMVANDAVAAYADSVQNAKLIADGSYFSCIGTQPVTVCDSEEKASLQGAQSEYMRAAAASAYQSLTLVAGLWLVGLLVMWTVRKLLARRAKQAPGNG